ncbi:hypothetical protein [Weizmannia sp. FSL W8-0401]|uniref:hypothetical protein n=1 Tax=Weizmannia sp. FSL W8-0401 TaxID=2954554 RepID=UPI0030F5433C
MHSKTIYIEEGGFTIKAFLIFLTSISLIMLMTNGCTTSKLKTGSIGSGQSKTEGSFPEFTLKVKIINHATDQNRFLLGIDRYGFENSKIAVFPSASTQIVDDKFNIRVKDGIKYTLSVWPTNMMFAAMPNVAIARGFDIYFGGRYFKKEPSALLAMV